MVRYFSRCMNKDRLDEIIIENVENLLNEELSVNNELEVSVNSLCDDIINRFSLIDEYSYSRTGVTLSNGTESLVSGCLFNTNLHFMGNDYKCLVKIRIFWDKQTLMEFYKQFDIGSQFEQSHNFFEFTLPCLKEEGLNRQFMFNNIYHEVEHSLQYIMIGDNTISDKYNIAVAIMNEQIPKTIKGNLRNVIIDNFSFTQLLSIVYYFYYPLELDANINGLYGELVENGLNLYETNYWVNKSKAENEFNKLIELGENEELNEIYKLFGFSNLNKFVKYVNKQQNYLKHKEMKVMQRAKNKLNLQESVRFTSWHSKPPYLK